MFSMHVQFPHEPFLCQHRWDFGTWVDAKSRFSFTMWTLLMACVLWRLDEMGRARRMLIV